MSWEDREVAPVSLWAACASDNGDLEGDFSVWSVVERQERLLARVREAIAERDVGQRPVDPVPDFLRKSMLIEVMGLVLTCEAPGPLAPLLVALAADCLAWVDGLEGRR